MVENLYTHFPFCRSRCSYCTLYSRTGSSSVDREGYVCKLVNDFSVLKPQLASLKTVYFGGGSPGLCDLEPLFEVLGPSLSDDYEFTVELHPLDVTPDLLKRLKSGGVNRISMGVQSLDDSILFDMNRGYTFMEAERAFYLVKEYFDNAGIDLIVGYPGETAALLPRHARLSKWGLRHCSVYALQNERGLKNVVDDDTVLDRIAIISAFLKDLGLERYEISNYAVPGFECRHNLSVWRGEDYVGLGQGAFGRVGLKRTPSGEELSPVQDLKERTIFRLRTREGLVTTKFPEWIPVLDRYVEMGLLTKDGTVYRLTARGAEVCDSILEDLI